MFSISSTSRDYRSLKEEKSGPYPEMVLAICISLNSRMDRMNSISQTSWWTPTQTGYSRIKVKSASDLPDLKKIDTKGKKGQKDRKQTFGEHNRSESMLDFEGTR